MVSYTYFPLIPIAFIINLYYWVRAKEHFTADSNGGIVLSVRPTLVAVYTDLTKGGNSYPVIKVIKFHPKRRVCVGDRIGTIGVYSDKFPGHPTHWSKFHPIPIEYAANDSAEIEVELDSYVDEQWRKILEGISQLPKPFRIGLYRVKIESEQ